MSKQDYIAHLPTDEKQPTIEELYLVNTLFTNNSDISKLFSGLKDTILVGFLFIFFNMPFVNNLVKKIFKSTKNSHIIFIIIKSFMFMLLYFIIINFVLSKDTI